MANIIEITDFNSPQLDIYARMSEGQLLNRHEPEKGIFIAESPKVVERALDAVLLTHGCSNPLYRRAIRVSMGTVFQIPWTFLDKEKGVSELKELGFKTAAMALTDDSVSIDNEELLAEEKLAIVLGTEGDGLAKETIADCDYTVKIPMSHGVDSLNVAAASAVAFWQMGK